MSIFISICAYNDPLLISTIQEALEKANNPEDLFFGLALSYENYPDLSFIPENKKIILKFDPSNRPGVNHKRYLIASMFNNQDYFLQIDSHMSFSKDWDIQLIKTLNKLKKISNNENVVLSNVKDINQVIDQEYRYITKEDQIKIKPSFNVMRFEAHLLFNPDFSKLYINVDEFMKTNIIKSNFIFADKNFIKEVGFDPYSQILNEEPFHSFLTFVKGWDVYHTPKYQFLVHKNLIDNYKKIWGEEQDLKNRIFGPTFFYHQDIKNRIIEEQAECILMNKSSIYNFENLKRTGKEWLSLFNFNK